MSSLKMAKYISREELPDFFRELAHAIETGEGGDLSCANEFKKMKFSVKDEYGQISLRAKIKSAAECVSEDIDVIEDSDGTDPGAVPPKPKYKALKKRMGKSFDVIFKMIHQGQMPPKAAVEEFLADSKLMVAYPGYGDPYYEEYIAACDAFAAAYAVADMEQLNETVDKLVHQKGHCHARYK